MPEASRDLGVTQLTNTAIDAAPTGTRLKDDRVPGLELRKREVGGSWMLYYRTEDGRQRRPKIGSYPALGIADARKKAKQELAKVALGRDPAAERAAALNEATMDELWYRCEREHWNNPARAWHVKAKCLYRSYAKTRLGAMRVSVVAYADIANLHMSLKDTPIAANRMLAVISSMLDLAERWGLRPLGSNPCRHVKHFPENQRRRYASTGEIAAIGAVLNRYAEMPQHRSAVAFIYLLMFSGARPSEIANGTPEMIERREIDGTMVGVLRLEHGKTGRRDVFLPPQAMRVIDQLPPDRPHLAGRRSLPYWLWRKIREEIGCTDLWIRDWRRTFGTVALTNGMSLGQVGELLGHASVQTTKRYAKLMEAEAHAAAASVASRMEELLGGV